MRKFWKGKISSTVCLQSLKNLQIQVIVKSFGESIYFSSLHDSEEKPQLNFQRIL